MTKTALPVFVVLIFLLSSAGVSQESLIYNGLSAKVNVGMSAVQGDLAPNPAGSFADMKIGYGISGMKMFSPFFGIQVRYSSSNLARTNADLREQYTGQISEIGLSARIEPLSGPGRNGPKRIFPYFQAGISNARYRAIRWNTTTQQIIPPSFGYRLTDLTPGPRENALSFPLGVGVGIRISPRITAEIEQSFSFLNTDYLDALEGINQSNDRFSFTSIGIRYSFMPADNSATRRSSTPTRRDREQPQQPEKQGNQQQIEGTSNQKQEVIDPYNYEIPVSSIYLESMIPDYPLSGRVFQVVLKIHKKQYTGPASVIQTYPKGFTAIKAPLMHADLEFRNQQAVITWDQMPIDSIITIRYQVHIDPAVSGPHKIRGRLWYSTPGDSKYYQFTNQIYVANSNEIEMDKKFMNILAERKSEANPYSTSVMSAEETQNTDIDRLVNNLINSYSQSGVISIPDYKKPATGGSVTPLEKELVPEEDLDSKIQNLIGAMGPDAAGRTVPEESQSGDTRQVIRSGSGSQTGYSALGNRTGVEFKVQIAAMSNRSELVSLLKRHNIREQVTEEFHNGLYKYTVGTLRSYQEATQFRDDFIKRTNLLSVFIVGYRDGIRQQDLARLK